MGPLRLVIVADIQAGMARIFTCAPGLVKLIMGGEWSATGLPECFEMTEDRLRRLQQGVGSTVF